MGKKTRFIILYHHSMQSRFDWIGLERSEVDWAVIVMAPGWVVIRFTTIYPLCMRTHTQTHQLQTIRYKCCMRDDEWLPHWMFYTKNSIDSRLIDNDRLSGKYENIVIRMQRENDSQCDWISANRCLVRVPTSRQWELSFVRMDISTPLFSSIYAVFFVYLSFF